MQEERPQYLDSDSLSVWKGLNPTVTIQLPEGHARALAIALHALSRPGSLLSPLMERLRDALDAVLGVNEPGVQERVASRQVEPPPPQPPDLELILQGITCTADCGWPHHLHTQSCQVNRLHKAKQRRLGQEELGEGAGGIH